MKQSKLFLIAATALATFASCSSDMEEVYAEKPAEASAPTTLSMHFNACVTPFDAENTTRAGSWEWTDGATVYIQFHSGSNLVRGHATYSKSTDSWQASYNGAITKDAPDKCEVYYFDGVTTSDYHQVTLTGREAIYADKAAIYIQSGAEVTLQAQLSPMTSRVRFTGSQNLGITIGGITTYTGYNADNNTFATSTTDYSLTVGDNGSTPYLYGTFTDESTRQMTIANSTEQELIFTKSFGSSVLQKGKSGFIAIPLSSNNKGWMENNYFGPERTYKISGNGLTNITFKMKLVEPGTFQMGSNDGESDEKPVHSVTLTKAYYMGQTEVTQALWQAVMGYKPTNGGNQWSSQYGLGNDYPAYYISYTDCEEFITKLNAMTGKKFRIPTEAEWEFAAKGGTKTKGYKYAGSDNIGDVAWYTSNSGSKTHVVGGKQANELGLYDMSGNVWEWCADWYGSYTSGAQTNPTGPTTGSYRVIRGGGWGGSATSCRAAYRGNLSPGDRDYYLGFRLAL